MTFNLEKARDVCAGMERFRGQTIQCTHIEAHLAAAMLPEALAEIERLRAENAGLSKAVIDIQEERDLAQAEFRAYHKAWEEQAAHVPELEDALVDVRARSFPVWAEEPRVARDTARLQLQAEGEIGPGTKPRSWQITEERKAAFVWILRRLEYDQSLPGHTYYKIQQAMELLRAMLEEAGQ